MIPRLTLTVLLSLWLCTLSLPAIEKKPGSTAEGAGSSSAQSGTNALWNRDRAFLNGMSSEQRTSPTGERANPTEERAKLRKLVDTFVVGRGADDVDEALRFYADRVDFYEGGEVRKKFIRRQMLDFNEMWPERRYWVGAMVQIVDGARIVDLDMVEVQFPIGFVLRNGPAHRIGKAAVTMKMKKTPSGWEIVSVKENPLD